MTFLFSYASHAGILVVLVDYAHPTRWKASGGGEPEKREERQTAACPSGIYFIGDKLIIA